MTEKKKNKEQKKKYKIGIDIDGVLRDFSTTFHSLMKRDYPDVVLTDTIVDWDFEKSFTMDRKELQKLYWGEYKRDVFRFAPPIKDSIMHMRKLFIWADENKHKLIAVSSQRPTGRSDSLYWLGNHYLGFEEVHFIRGEKKWKKDIDWLVDDSPENYKHWINNRDEDGFILFDAPYNQYLKPTYRVKSLWEITNIIN